MASSAVDSGGLPISSETEFTYTIPTVNQVKSNCMRVESLLSACTMQSTCMHMYAFI
jgi:hypothetical protein